MAAPQIQPSMEMQQTQLIPGGLPKPVGYEGGNPIIDTVGQRFAIVPNVYKFDGCCSPDLVQKLHVVPTAGIHDPVTARNVAQQVVRNAAAAPTPFQSFIHQTACCGLPQCSKGLLGDQTFSNAQGIAAWSFEEVTPCCRHPRLVAFHADKREIGQLRYGKPTCGMLLSQCLCSCICRSASWPEWAWLTAVDANEQPLLTFRNPATEGECLLFKYCCKCPARHSEGCCYVPPDVPYHEHMNLYGPMGSSAVLGTVDVRGAYGWDKVMGCCLQFGIRPEMTTEVALQAPLTFEQSVLAMQMGLTVANTALYYRNAQGYKRQVPFIKPGGQVMQ